MTVQVDDGHPVGPDGRGRDISSSASHPGVVAQMLAASGAQPGERVLEIGTGYNTALLAHRFGAPNVVSVEIDETPRLLPRHTGAGFTCSDCYGAAMDSGEDGRMIGRRVRQIRYAPGKPLAAVVGLAGISENRFPGRISGSVFGAKHRDVIGALPA